MLDDEEKIFDFAADLTVSRLFELFRRHIVKRDWIALDWMGLDWICKTWIGHACKSEDAL
jgi:hypothetical protein